MMPETSHVRKQIKDYILEISKAEEDKITDETLIFKEGFFDSMGFILLVTYLEENLNIGIKDDELIEDNFESIRKITEFVIRKGKNEMAQG